jgi:16S rRNA (guanine527-N7)-methyltransferase
VVTHHLLDCLAIVLPLRQEFSRNLGRRILDVGSGAGLPGVVIATVDPTAEVTCIDSVGKKAAFIAQAATSLGLRNVTVVHGRIEALQVPGFDVITSRAFAALPSLVRLTDRLLNPRGVWLAMKGKVPVDDIDGLGTAYSIEVVPLQVPGMHAERCIVRIQRAGDDGEHTLSR